MTPDLDLPADVTLHPEPDDSAADDERLDEELDDELDDSFPASDPPGVTRREH